MMFFKEMPREEKHSRRAVDVINLARSFAEQGRWGAAVARKTK